MVKYDESLKLELVQRYVSGLGGTEALVKQHGVGRTTLRFWVDRDREHGVRGLSQQ